jgi:diguanylate cyclase (GGDEF)-like protein/PAS domain S-box-containing protein
MPFSERLAGPTDGQAMHAYPEFEDWSGVQERNAAEESGGGGRSLGTSDARLRAILDAALDCIILSDHRGRILEFNPAAERTFGYRREEVLGREMAELIVPPRYRRAHRRGLARAARSGQSTFLGRRVEMTALRADGTEFPVELTITLVDGPGPHVFAGYVRDITQQKRAEAEVERLAYHDGLTGLPNRAMFEEHLQLALARARRTAMAVAVLYLDLDNLKTVNDSLGHEAGDRLLRQVGERMRTAARESDLVARQGGDEFLVLLSDLPRRAEGGVPGALEGAVTAARRIAALFSEPFDLVDATVQATASIGIAVYPFHGEDSTELLARADAAMYQGKWSGGGSFVFADDAEAARRRLSMASELRTAVEEEQWVLHFQPIVHLETGGLFAAEALLRWRHPTGRLAAPTEFLPLADEMGLGDRIGRWVLREAGREAEHWRQGGLDLAVAVNLASAQLWRTRPSDDLGDEIERAGLDPERLILEVTETALMRDPERAIRVLEDLGKRGARLAIDDFGTGYSSVARLRELPVHMVKIHESFLLGVGHDDQASSVAEALLVVARGLGVEPLAEGVESESQRRFLLDHGCEKGQGFLFSAPLPAEGFLGRFGTAAGRGVGASA